MALPALNDKLAKFKPQPAIPKGKEVKVEGVLVTGTGYPYYTFQPSLGKSLITLHPRQPSGAPLEGITTENLILFTKASRLTLAEPPLQQYEGDAEKDEVWLNKVVTLEIPYSEALKSIGEGFFDASSNEDCVRVHDGREWVRYKGSYWVQFNWQTNTQAALGASKRITKRQMERVLDDLVRSGGSVQSAIRKLYDNGFIAGDQESFWTADRRRYRMTKGKWVQYEGKGIEPGMQPPDDGTTTATVLDPDLDTLRKRYPTRKQIRRVRTWAGPRMIKIKPLEDQRLPANPTSSRPGNRGVKREKNNANDHDGRRGNTGNRGDNGEPGKGGRKKPAATDPPTKPGTRRQPERNAKK
ncbi:MAG: hypothetical protein M1830_007168 [Pleopsidium flavum]|nr:MAG: hypothetical protein M1830_007168 [Pleopsidium flavum]